MRWIVFGIGAGIVYVLLEVGITRYFGAYFGAIKSSIETEHHNLKKQLDAISGELEELCQVRIPAMPITHSDLMAIRIPSDADHRRSEATLSCSYHAEVIGIRQAFCR